MGLLKNTKHELVAQEIAKGGTIIAAYTKAGYKPNTGHASRLASKGSIQRRIAELQENAAFRTQTTVASLEQELEEARALAARDGTPSAMVAASMGKAKLLGFLTDKQQISVDDPVAQLLSDFKGSVFRPTEK